MVRQSTLPGGWAGRQETDCRLPIGRAGRYIGTVPLFWLNYHNAERRAVVVVEAEALVAARMKAALAGLDAGMDFASDGADSQRGCLFKAFMRAVFSKLTIQAHTYYQS